MKDGGCAWWAGAPASSVPAELRAVQCGDPSARASRSVLPAAVRAPESGGQLRRRSAAPPSRGHVGDSGPAGAPSVTPVTRRLKLCDRSSPRGSLSLPLLAARGSAATAPAAAAAAAGNNDGARTDAGLGASVGCLAGARPCCPHAGPPAPVARWSVRAGCDCRLGLDACATATPVPTCAPPILARRCIRVEAAAVAPSAATRALPGHSAAHRAWPCSGLIGWVWVWVVLHMMEIKDAMGRQVRHLQQAADAEALKVHHA
jgi:hypothetical protein